MFVFDAGKIVKALGSLRNLEAAINHFQYNPKIKKNDVISRAAAKHYRPLLNSVRDAVSGLDARATGLAIKELRDHFNAHKLTITYALTSNSIEDIAVTLRRELSLIKTFCVSPAKELYFQVDFGTFGHNFEIAFPSSVFEIDEAGKCHALGRSTASVFHLMRAMEIGIKAIARSLGIPDPVKGNDRNWGNMLAKIKTEMDRRAAGAQWQNDDKNLFAGAYVSLDAVRVAWRNTTMHVENKYTDEESEHIFIATRGFMKRLSDRMDENGNPLA